MTLDTVDPDVLSANVALIPLNCLTRSPLNVRRAGGTDVAELADLISAHGLLQNLIVTPDVKRRGKARVKPTAHFYVIAGARRLEALNSLASQGRIARDLPIRCLVVTDNEAISTSLAENSGREDLNPVDQFLAFQSLADAGKTVEDIARSFGVSTKRVERRLKLAKVAPRFLDLFREQAMTLDQLMALAVSDDADQQMRAWDSLPSWNRSAERLRRLLTAGDIDAQQDRLARFVGIDAYVAAGGVVHRDLFSDDENAGFLTDATLLQTLAQAKLDAAAVHIQSTEGLAWVETRLELDRYMLPPEFVEAGSTRRDPTPQEVQAIAALELRLESLQEERDAQEDQEAEEALQQAIDAVDAEINVLYAQRSVPRPEFQGMLGALVGVDAQGVLRIIRNLVRRADFTAVGQAVAANGSAGEGSTAATKIRSPFSERLYRQLSAHRTVALQWAVANHPDAALAILAYVLAGRTLRSFGLAEDGVHVSVTPTRPEQDAPDLAQNSAFVSLAGLRQRLSETLPAEDMAGRRTQGETALLAWCLAQPQSVLLPLIAYGVAVSLDDGQRVPADRHHSSAALFMHLGIDMADCWQATAESFLSHV